VTDPSVVATKYWHRLEDGRVQCDVCPRYCKLHEGQRGFCFVRECRDSAVVLTTYGRSSGYCIDPIEKKPLNHFLPGTPVLSFGTAGCNLGCKFCQNWDISKSREVDTLADSASPDAIVGDVRRNRPVEEISARFHETLAWWIVGVARRCGLRHVALSGGCFQNAWLTRRAVTRLEAAGCTAFTHQRVPANDGGISLGQTVRAAV